MNTEIINNEMDLEEIENVTEEVMDTCEVTEATDSKKVVGLIIGAVVVGVGALIYKNRERIKNKIEDRQIRRLEKKGYVVYRATDDVDEFDYEAPSDDECQEVEAE